MSKLNVFVKILDEELDVVAQAILAINVEVDKVLIQCPSIHAIDILVRLLLNFDEFGWVYKASCKPHRQSMWKRVFSSLEANKFSIHRGSYTYYPTTFSNGIEIHFPLRHFYHMHMVVKKPRYFTYFQVSHQDSIPIFENLEHPTWQFQRLVSNAWWLVKMFLYPPYPQFPFRA